MWIYLSPHLDDAIFSCGGIIAAQVEKGEEIEVWTFFAGKPATNPPSKFANHLHFLYGYGSDPIGGRIDEDIKACSMLGIKNRHFSFCEAIYRTKDDGKSFLYPNPTAIFSMPLSDDRLLLGNIIQILSNNIKTTARVVVPFGIGKHVDHVLIRLAAETRGDHLFYYEDFPYAAKAQDERKWLSIPGLSEEKIYVEKKHLEIWRKMILIYKSQVPILWRSKKHMEQMLSHYYVNGGGRSIWQKNCKCL